VRTWHCCLQGFSTILVIFNLQCKVHSCVCEAFGRIAIGCSNPVPWLAIHTHVCILLTTLPKLMVCDSMYVILNACSS
jgi:hypothetical protein